MSRLRALTMAGALSAGLIAGCGGEQGPNDTMPVKSPNPTTAATVGEVCVTGLKDGFNVTEPKPAPEEVTDERERTLYYVRGDLLNMIQPMAKCLPPHNKDKYTTDVKTDVGVVHLSAASGNDNNWIINFEGLNEGKSMSFSWKQDAVKGDIGEINAILYQPNSPSNYPEEVDAQISFSVSQFDPSNKVVCYPDEKCIPHYISRQDAQGIIKGEPYTTLHDLDPNVPAMDRITGVEKAREAVNILQAALSQAV